MTDNVEQEQQQQQPEFPADVLEKLAELDRLKAHQNKLLEETKTAKQRAKELEEAQALAEQEALKKSGEFQKLWESEAEKASRLQKEMDEKESAWREKERARQQRDIEAQAIHDMKDHAVDASSLELLSEKARQFAVHTENGIEYQVGGVTVPKEKVIETLSAKYPRLFKGSGATGGGATGSNGHPVGANSNTKAQEAKSKGDLNGFLSAHLNH